MAGRLNAIPGVQCVQPTGAFYCFPDVSSHYGRTHRRRGRHRLPDLQPGRTGRRKVALVPGDAFGEDRCVRLSFATSMEQIDKGLDRLEALLK